MSTRRAIAERGRDVSVFNGRVHLWEKPLTGLGANEKTQLEKWMQTEAEAKSISAAERYVKYVPVKVYDGIQPADRAADEAKAAAAAAGRAAASTGQKPVAAGEQEKASGVVVGDAKPASAEPTAMEVEEPQQGSKDIIAEEV